MRNSWSLASSLVPSRELDQDLEELGPGLELASPSRCPRCPGQCPLWTSVLSFIKWGDSNRYPEFPVSCKSLYLLIKANDSTDLRQGEAGGVELEEMEPAFINLTHFCA